MSVIDRALREQATESPALTLREAAATVLVAAVAVDGAVAPEEAARLNAQLSCMRLYRQVPGEHMQALVDTAAQLAARTPLDELLSACAAVIPGHLRPAVFALAVELVFMDGEVAPREKAFVDVLQAALALNDETALKIVEVLLIKSRA
jgi:hypothetical protein